MKIEGIDWIKKAAEKGVPEAKAYIKKFETDQNAEAETAQ